MLSNISSFIRKRSNRKSARKHSRKTRHSQFERLECRRVLAAAIWNNVGHAVNVDGDPGGVVSPIDALLVINELNNPKYSEPGSGRLPKQVETQPNLFFDVSCDNFVSPIDALQVINHINLGGEQGTNGIGVYPSMACSPQLSEGSDFATELSQAFTLPDDSSAVKLYFRAPEFDTTSQGRIRDAFEIEITDGQGNPLSFPYMAERDALYNWSELHEPQFGAAVQTTTAVDDTDSTATINLAGLPAGTEIVVTSRLVNNDTDDATHIVLRGLELVPAPGQAPTGASFAQAAAPVLPNIDVPTLEDVTGSFAPSYGRSSLSGDNDTLHTELVVTNVGNQTVSGRLLVAVENFSDLDVAVLRPDGILPNGSPFFDLTAQMQDNALAPGESIRSREIAFRNTTGMRFNYRLRTLGSLNAAPTGFTSEPLTSIEAGKAYIYAAAAEDPENQPLSYSLVSGPEGMSVDATTGEVRWTTVTADVGRHAVILRATDPHGLYVEQRFTVSVLEALQNRPPNFITDPVTEAIASSGFEVTTVGVGSAPAGLAVIGGFQGPRLVTANAEDQTVGVYSGENNDRFDGVDEYSTRHPRKLDQWFDAGVQIDIGMPVVQSTFDSTDVDNLAQGDFNGDGILDLVAAYTYDLTNDASPGTSRAAVVLGDGNGAFGEPIEIFSREFRDDQILVRSLTVADVNNDGHDDVLLNDRYRDGLLVSVLGNGDGTFQPAVETVYTTSISDFQARDINGDGDLDLFGRSVTWNGADTSLFWSPGAGDGTFGEPIVFASTRNSDGNGTRYPYDLADLDGDGDLDFVISGDNSLIQVFHNDGSGNFTLQNEFDPPSAQAYYGPDWLLVADFTGDDQHDILFYHVWDGRLHLMVGDGSGVDFTFQEGAKVRPRADNWSTDFEPMDIDGDGDLDIAFGTEIHRMSPVIGLNDGTGQFVMTEYPMPDFSGDIKRNILDSTARGVQFGDYNSDGVMDFSYFTTDNDFNGNSGANGVGIRFGTRPGEFGRTRTVPWVTPAWVDVTYPGDFNGDGVPDLLDTGSDVTALGNGDGTFGDLIPATGVRRPSSNAAIADFNLDGLDDVVAALSGGLYVGLSNGDGTFSVPSETIPGGGFYGYNTLDLADFNLDGYMDFVAKVEVGSYFEVYLNDPSNPGSFQMSFSYSLAPGSQGINVSNWEESWDVGDFTGDGLPDLLTAERDSTPDFDPVKVVVFAGDGAGGFTRHSEFAGFDEQRQNGVLGSAIEPGDFSTGDIDEDGDLDVFAYTYRGGRIFLNDGTGHFTSNGTLTDAIRTNQRGRDSWLFDLDQDGHLDFISAAGSDIVGAIHFWRGDGKGSFEVYQSVKMHSELQGIREPFVDWDRDGHIDMVYATGDGSSDEVALYMGRRDDLVDLIAVDLNDDGNEELIAIQEQLERLQIFVGDNLGEFTLLPDLQTGLAPQAVTAADLNGDGAWELLTANRVDGTVGVYEGSLAAGFTLMQFPISTSGDLFGNPVDIEAADADGDGNTDVFVLDRANQVLWLFPGDNTTSLGTATPIAVGDEPGRFVLHDATGDGLLDAIITLPESNRLMILGAIGSPTVEAPVYVNLEGTPSDVAVLDLNADGLPELATTLADNDTLSIHYSLGNNQFARAQQVKVGDNPNRVAVTDADEDGRQDLVVSNAGDHTVSVIYNRFDPNEVYRYDSDAIDPDDDSLTYSIIDGPGGLIMNPSSGELLWAASPDQVGVHDVTIAADDGRGGVATQSFKIDVVPARENAAPIIATTPVTQIGASETFSYTVEALDNDNHPLRYSIVDGPEGATINPATGELHWDNRSQSEAFGISNQGGIIRVPIDDSLRPESITVEGWFQPSGTPTNNFFTRDQNIWLYFNNGGQSLRAWVHLQGESVLFDMPVQVQIDRWYHLALTYDATTGEVQVFVDGELAGSKSASEPKPLDTTPAVTVVGQQNGGTQGNYDNYRIWDHPRSAAEIREGMSRQYEDDPSLLLDLRFEETDTISVLDYSIYENHGYRISFVTETQPDIGLAEVGSHEFSILVEDGRGGTDTQSFAVNVVPELRGIITGRLFDDLNADGDQDDGSEDGVAAEPGLEGWHLFIDRNDNGYPDPAEPQATTNIDGDYRFERLLPGDYQVSVSPVAGYNTPERFTASVESEMIRELDSQASDNYDLAIEQLSLSQIRGHLQSEAGEPIAYWKAYADLDGDGQRGEDEPVGMSDRNGNYAIAGLEAGTYTLRLDLPAGWTDTGGNGGLDVVLAADDIATDNDFTLAPTNTSVTGGVHFVTMPANSVEARQTFTYASVAMGIGNATLTYDLSLAPEGMAIDPASGLVAWQPSLDQIGEHLVILRATDAEGSMALQDFYINVTAPNTPPIILYQPQNANPPSPAPTMGYAGIVYAYDIAAQDTESTTLTYALTQAPAGATIDLNTGRIHWTPAASAVGSHDFTVEVTDEGGASSTATWTVDVVSDAPTTLPLEIMYPRTTAAVNSAYFSRISAYDALGRPVDWTQTSGPAGLTVDTDGTIRWTPTNSQLGTQQIELMATTPDGHAENVSLVIDVLGRTRNAVPVFTSEPVTSVSLGNSFVYDAQVSDTDSDIHAFTLIEGPVGMSVHPVTGQVRWNPADDQLGEHDVRLQVSDPLGAIAEQSFALTVSRFGGPPRILSVPPTEASEGIAYLYTLQAIDHEGDPLTYSVLTSPAGLTITPTTGEIAWTPDASQVGLQDVVVQVSDGIGGAATQAFVINVTAGAPNLPPEITTSAPRFGAVGTSYSYALMADDPEATAITYSLGRGPAGMTVDPSSGQVTWTPASDQAGQHVVTLVASDAGGASAIESFTLDVLAQNTGPVIHSPSPDSATAGALFAYDVLADDADLDVLQYELSQAPIGATIDAFGRLRWQTQLGAVGNYDFSVKVSDPRGGEVMQNFTVELVADTEGPTISLIETPNDASRNILPWQGPFVVYARAIDNVEVASLTLSANGQDIPLDAAGTATFAFEDWFFNTINATATAIDTSGNVTTRSISFNYDVPEGWSTNPGPEVPTAIITSPADNGTAMGMVSITGTADHADFGAYTLSYRHVDETSFTEILRSTTPVVDGELGVWDTSLLLNDEYVIRLQVATTEGTANVVEHHVGLAGELKLGNFQLSFTDMVIPVAGIPIEITRIYDTLQADRQGDFGYGWRLEYRDTDLRVGLPKSGLEDIGIYSALRPGVKVYLNVPGEGRQGFTFNPDIRVLPGWGGNNLVLARPRFTPDPGVTSTLGTGTSSYLQVNEQGELYAPGGIPYNPASPDFGGAYVLTTDGGFVYRIDGASGKLTTATSPNGVAISFSDRGLKASLAEIELVLERDSSGRITSILDPNGNAIHYEYASGELVGVIDRDANSTTFSYRNDGSHFLDSVVDPLGRTGARQEYSADGRLSALINSDGSRIEFNYDIEASTQTSRDRLGRETQYVYDNSGNVLLIIDAAGQVFRSEYDANGNQTAEIDALGNRTEYVYNAHNLLVRKVAPNGSITTHEYDDAGNLARSVDAIGQAVTSKYDSSGNLKEIETLAGSTINYVGNGSTPQSVHFDDEEISRFEYDTAGRVIKQITPSATIEYTYDASGNLLSATSTTTENILTESRTYTADGKLLQSQDSSGNQTQFRYDPFGNIEELIQNGKSTVTRWTESGQISSREFPDGGTIEAEYDAVGNLVLRRDPRGNETRFVYDELDRLIETIYADDTPGELSDNPRRRVEYDANGRVIARIDELGNRTQFEYDAEGRLVLERDALGGLTTFQYDGLGRLSERTNPLGQTTRSKYDRAGNVTSEIYSNGSSVSAAFDHKGNLVEVIDANGVPTRYEYDLVNRLTGVIDAFGYRTQYEYDAEGNLISVIDAKGNTTTYNYDQNGRQISETLPEGQSDERTYDSDGRLSTYTNFNGQTTSYEYDQADRVTRIEYGDNTIESFTYDLNGNLLTAANSLGTALFAYDNRDRLTRFTSVFGQAIEYRYDGAGNLVSQQTDAGSSSFGYDESGRMVSADFGNNALVTYQYNAASDLEETSYSNGITLRNTYDAAGRIKAVEHVNPDGSIANSYHYELDASGRIKTVTEEDGRVTRWNYDKLYRLISEESSIPQGLSYRITYTYDAVGNRISETHSENGLREFDFDNNNRMVSIETPSGESIYNYDANGNLTSVSHPDGQERLTWNARDQLIEVVTVDGSASSTSTYSYDALGHRVSRDLDGDTVRFLVDPSFENEEVIAVYDSAGDLVRRHGIGLTRAVSISGTETVFFGPDLHSGIRAEFDSTGAISREYLFDSLGRELLADSPSGFLFRGQQRDPGTALDYLRARYYSPATGTFLSRDPFEGYLDQPISLNEYLYASGDPINNSDPSGETSLAEQLVVFAKRNALNIAFGLGFGIYKAKAAYDAGQSNALKLLGIVAKEVAISIAFGEVFHVAGRAISTFGVGLLKPQALQLAMQQATRLPGFGKALHIGYNTRNVLASLQAVGWAAAIGQGAKTAVVKGLPAVVVQGRQITGRKAGETFVRLIQVPGKKIPYAIGDPIFLGRTAQGVSKGFGVFMGYQQLSFTSRVAANTPQFTALLARLLYAADESGASVNELPVVD